MLSKRKHILVIVELAIAMFAQTVCGQTFTSINLPDRACGGTSHTFTFGFNPYFDVVVTNPTASLNHPERVFLPDGVPCGENGCSYRSPVTFDGFLPEGTITSAQDIKYVRLNIEHSYIADIYINITCPNGQKADIMRFGGMNDSDCNGSIPQSSTGWLSGDNVAQHNKFGLANDIENTTYDCDSTASGNEPGVGWNYCWSDNMTNNYTYGNGDGKIYRNGNAHNGIVDSTNTMSGTNFYHPDESFSNLIGCPLNGSWYIEVVDGFNQDNGYIFDWELALEPSLLPTTCVLEERMAISPYCTAINDSNYRIDFPEVDSDTTIIITLMIVNSCGDTNMVDVPITVLANSRADMSVSVCGQYVINNETIYNDTVIDIFHEAATANGCDSITHLNIHVFPNNNVEVYDTVVENDLPVLYNGVTFNTTTDTTFQLTNQYFCDSIVHYRLKVWENVVVHTTWKICINDLENEGFGYVTSQSYDTVMYSYTSHGADSIVYMHIDVLPVYEIDVVDTICSNIQYYVGDNMVDSSGHYDIELLTTEGCDSLVHLDLTIYPAYDILISDTVCANNGTFFDGEQLFTEGTYIVNETTINDCDSIVTLQLTIKGKELEAIPLISPSLVTNDNLEVRLTDRSLHSIDRLWKVGTVESHLHTMNITYPKEYDSLDVMLVAYDKEGCTDTVQRYIYIDRSKLAVPNVFTPSKETNNRWSISTMDVDEIEVWIYDRSGNLVYHYTGTDGYWDGRMPDGTPAPQAAYTFAARYRTTLNPSRLQVQRGTITLIR